MKTTNQNNQLEILNDIFNIHHEKLADIGMEDYDEIIYAEDEDAIEGRHMKNFFRIDSKILNPYLERLKTQNYITHFSNILKQDLMLEKISVLKKNLPKNAIIRECLSSNILNFYGLNVPYNFYTHHTNKTGKHHRLISVDFISDNQKFATFEDLKIFQGLHETKYKSLPAVANTVHSFFKKQKSLQKPQYKKEITKIEKDILKALLVRLLLLRDSDFCDLNIGLILDKKANELSLINYDFESTFSDQTFDENDVHNLNQVRLHFPDLYNEFIEKSRLLYSIKDNLNVEYLDEYHKKCVDFIFKRLEKIQNTAQDFETTQLSIFEE